MPRFVIINTSSRESFAAPRQTFPKGESQQILAEIERGYLPGTPHDLHRLQRPHVRCWSTTPSLTYLTAATREMYFGGGERLVTDVEVFLQEILYRTIAIERKDAISRIYSLLGNPAACRGHKTDGVSPVE